MHVIDHLVLFAYVGSMVAAGFLLRRRAAGSEESYFLGNRRLPWWVLSMSGAVSTYDITGTMWVISLFYLYGVRSLWVHWLWGFMMGAFLMSYTGKWVRRSRVITGSQWMTTRFGRGREGEAARGVMTFMAVVFSVSVIAYAFTGIGKFASEFLPWSKNVCGVLIIGVTTLYVVLGGVYSVVITDVIQTVVLTGAAGGLAVYAFVKADVSTLLEKVAEGWHSAWPAEVANKAASGWDSLWPAWDMPFLAENAVYICGPFLVVWILKGTLLNAGGPAQLYDFQRFLSTRTARDASKAGALWSFFLLSRWAMCMGIVVLGLTLLKPVFNVEHAERVLPKVLHELYLPVGVKGIILAGFFAAFMSTFDSTVNVCASYIVEDFYKRFLRPKAETRELIYAGYAASILVVAVGIAIGLGQTTIAGIWRWIMLAYGSVALIPNVLRWYWWRFNGWGYTWGTVGGVVVLFFLTVFFPAWSETRTCPIIVSVSLVCCLLGTFLTRPTNPGVLETFYKEVQPGGLWRRVARSVVQKSPSFKKDCSFGLELFNTLLGIVFIMSVYMASVTIVLRKFSTVLGLLGVCGLTGIVLYFTWYRNLPRD
jgi:solute:Na+ symporter, SSS family